MYLFRSIFFYKANSYGCVTAAADEVNDNSVDFVRKEYLAVGNIIEMMLKIYIRCMNVECKSEDTPA